MHVKRSVLKRTRNSSDLPALVLYVDMVAGQTKRRVVDSDGNEHVIDETVLQSHYKLVTWTQAKELLGKYWPKLAKPVVD